MKKITKLATRLRVALTLCTLFAGYSLANAADITIVPNEDLELGSDVLLSEKYTAPTTQNTTTYTAVEITPSVSGTLYVCQLYKASQQSTCNLLYNSTVFSTGSYSGDFIVEGTSLENAYTYQSWEYELSANETYYYFSYLGLKNNSVSAANAIEFQFLWIPESVDVEIPLNTDYEVKEGNYYTVTTPDNGKFLTITSNVELPSVTSSSGITNSTFIYREFGKMLGQGNGQGENIAGSSVDDGEYQYLISQTQNRTFFIKASGDATVKFEAAEVLSPGVTSITPAPGETISNSYWEGEVELAFNPSVGFAAGNGSNMVSVTYTAAGAEEEMTVKLTPERKNKNWTVNFLEYYLAAEPGTEIKISIDGLQYFGFKVSENLTGNDNVSIENGVISFSYPKPVFTAEVYNWPMIYAYYAPNTAAGIVTLTFNETITGADSNATLTFGDPEAEDAPVVNIPVTYKNNTLTFNFTGIDFERVTGVDLSGFDYSTATLSLSGLTSLSGQEYDGDGIFTQTLNFSDTYYGNVAPERYMTQEATIISPAVGTYLPALYEFVIAWGEDNPVFLEDGSLLATLSINEGEEVYVPVEVDAEGYLIVDVEQYSKADGENVYGVYSITLPEGLVVNEANLMNNEQTLLYDWADPNPKTDSYMTAEASIISPAEGAILESLENIVISWGEENAVTLVEANSTAILKIGEGEEVDAPVSINADGDLVVNVSQWSTIDGDNVFGIYSITVPEGLVVNAADELNEEQTLTYEWKEDTSAISFTEVENLEDVVIYNLQGIRMKVGDATQLPKGVYIVNGKKIVKK